MKTIVGIAQSYAEEKDTGKNKARIAYERAFDFYCREAKKEKRDLWEYLSTEFMIPEERHLIKPPADLYNKKEKQDYIKGQYWLFYYEWTINRVLFPTVNELKELLLDKSDGGKKTVKITSKGRIAKEEKIRKKIKELITLGEISPSIKRGDITTIANALKLKYNYVQEYIKLQNSK